MDFNEMSNKRILETLRELKDLFSGSVSSRRYFVSSKYYFALGHAIRRLEKDEELELTKREKIG